jgi:aminoglycoside/choline kinase family phosphotransferase
MSPETPKRVPAAADAPERADPAVDPRLALLEAWVRDDLGHPRATVRPASADASFRRYFRVADGDRTWIAMDAPPEKEDVGPFVAVAEALGAVGVNVPRILAADRARGFLLLTDLGSRHYLAELGEGGDADRLYGDAATALLAIQTRAPADRLPPYGVALLDREVQLLPDWFLGRHLGAAVDAGLRDTLERASARLAVAALEQPQVFVHRDYHSRNLMVCPDANPGIIDFQDAVRGAVTYDLVSLWKDAYIVWPRARVLGWLEDYRRRGRAAGLLLPDAAEFVRWFDLMGLQRHLKVLGIFARLWYRDGKSAYLNDLPTVLAYVDDVLPRYGELSDLRRAFAEVVPPRFAGAQARALA